MKIKVLNVMMKVVLLMALIASMALAHASGIPECAEVDVASGIKRDEDETLLTLGKDSVFNNGFSPVAVYAAVNDGEEDKEASDKALALFKAVNEYRKANKLPAYKWNDQLAVAATVRSQEIVVRFSHTRPNKKPWWTVDEEVCYGENLAKGSGDVSAILDAWKASRSHKSILLDGEFTTVGFACYKQGDKWYVAMECGY